MINEPTATIKINKSELIIIVESLKNFVKYTNSVPKIKDRVDSTYKDFIKIKNDLEKYELQDTKAREVTYEKGKACEVCD